MRAAIFLAYAKYEREESGPPECCGVPTDALPKSARYRLEIPAQGGMAKDKFAALQAFLGQVVAKDGKCATVLDGVEVLRRKFWGKCLDGHAGDGAAGGILEWQGRVRYHGPKYVSYSITCQDGCPCCTVEQNVVWSWDKLRGIRMDEVVDAGRVAKLKQLMRKQVAADFADSYADKPGCVLPEYADNWPETLDNFRVDDEGIAWTYDASAVLLGGKGPCDVTLTWADVRPVLIGGKFELKG
ncbi:MAG: hypothetical protein ACI4RD_04015 [Kiritimatiellia bacterium]